MLCLKQPVTAAKAETGADSCGLQMSKQILPSDNKNKLITFVATSGLISGKQDKKKKKERERERKGDSWRKGCGGLRFSPSS